jgi:hypothetical protein
MSKFFTRERFGRPQFLAAALLLVFLAQALWLMHTEFQPSESNGSVAFTAEQARIAAGWRQLHGAGIAGAPYPDRAGGPLFDESRVSRGFDTQHSPLLPLVSAAPLLAWPRSLSGPQSPSDVRWLPRLPFLACGVLLGASLWYVARRLCGNAGGLLALTLYCFSPSMIQAAAVWHMEPEILAAWGSFGAIFTAIAVAHTLYAPREVILWNWRRIVLLAVALAIAVGSQFSMIIVLPLALLFMLYLAPIRRGAAGIIWISSSLLAVLLLFAIYFFQVQAFVQGMQHAAFWGVSWRAFTVFAVYRSLGREILRACPPLVFLLPVGIAAYVAWPRTRYFGNTAPGLVALLFIGLGIAHPDTAGDGFFLASLPFLLIFVCGIVADLMETSYRQFVTIAVWALAAAYILWSLLALVQVPRSA